MKRFWYGVLALIYSLALALLIVAALAAGGYSAKAATDPSLQYRATLMREAQAIYGINAPIPMLAGQIKQESNWRANVTAFDLGRGLSQTMDATGLWLSKMYPELGAPDPYNPRWSIRALVRYDNWLYKRVKGENDCERFGAALKSYNAGLGYTQHAQTKSPTPEIWFTKTEYLNVKQSPHNFEYSRIYPRIILFNYQTKYLTWGHATCLPYIPEGSNKLP